MGEDLTTKLQEISNKHKEELERIRNEQNVVTKSLNEAKESMIVLTSKHKKEMEAQKNSFDEQKQIANKKFCEIRDNAIAAKNKELEELRSKYDAQIESLSLLKEEEAKSNKEQQNAYETERNNLKENYKKLQSTYDELSE